MKKITSLLLTSALMFPALQSYADELTTQKQKASYTLGVAMAKRFKDQLVDIDIRVFMQGYADAVNNNDMLLNDEQRKQAIRQLQRDLITKRLALRKRLVVENKEKGQNFLSKNQKQPNVQTTDSGLQYKVIQEGKGKSPTMSDFVIVEYEATNLTGQVVDKTVKRKGPAHVSMSKVIKGWQEGLQLMKPGSVYEFYIPAKLAFGVNGVGQKIGPNETLIYKVHLLKVTDKAPVFRPAPNYRR